MKTRLESNKEEETNKKVGHGSYHEGGARQDSGLRFSVQGLGFRVQYHEGGARRLGLVGGRPLGTRHER